MSLISNGTIDAIDTVDGDLIVHGAAEIYRGVNYETGACQRYLASAWNDVEFPAEVEAKVEAKVIALSRSDQLQAEQPIRAALSSLGIDVPDSKPVTLPQLKKLVKSDAKYKPKGSPRRDDYVKHILAILANTPPPAPRRREAPKPHPQFYSLVALVHSPPPDQSASRDVRQDHAYN